MVYNAMTKIALKISFNAHKKQFDKNGIPYVYHPFRLAEQAKTEEETIVALLHDVIEDADYSLDDLKKEEFSDEIIDALALLSHDEAIPYMDYVAKIKNNSLAKAVKIEDLYHNSNLSRLDDIDGESIKRVQKYFEAIKLLSEEESEIENVHFCCYREKNVSLYGKIMNGCLKLKFCVYGDEYISEKYYNFTKENTVKLFSVVSLNEFIDLSKTKSLCEMELFLKDNRVLYDSAVI